MKTSPFTVLLVWAALSIAGLAFLPLLKVQWQPSHTLPSVTISYYWANVSGRIIEQEVTSLLEGGLNRVRGIRQITSTSKNNSGNITIEFDKTVDMDAARFEVASIIRQIYPQLPDGVSFPALSLNRPDNEEEKALLVFSLQAQANPAGIQQFAEERIKPLLAQADDVNRVTIYGASPYEWMIEYDSRQLAAAGLTPSVLKKAVIRYYSLESLGTVKEEDISGRSSWTRLTVGSNHANTLQLEKIPLTTADDRVLYLGDIARIKHMEQEPASYYRVNGLNTINIVVYASTRANHIVLAAEVKKRAGNIEQDLPGRYSLSCLYDSTEHIEDELDKIYIRTIATICILLLFILVVTRRFRFLVIILSSILANICIALGMYYLTGVEIHLYSLAGITISLGLIIDNTIVMVEHIRSRGNRRVFTAILAATLTTAISLSAVFFLDDRIKLNLVDFAVVVIINLLVSLAGAWFLTPALYEKLVGQPQVKQAVKVKRPLIKASVSLVYTRVISIIYRYRRLAWILLVLAFGLPLFLLPDKMEGESEWAALYNHTLGKPWYQETIRPVTDKLLGGTLRLFTKFVYEGSTWNPDRERTALHVNVTMPPGATILQMNRCMEDLEAYLSGFDEIEIFQTNIYNAQNAYISITFKKEHESGYFPHILKSRLITWGIKAGAADWGITGYGEGFSNRFNENTGSYQIKLFGYNYDQLYEYAGNIKSGLLENPRIQEVNLMSRYTWYKNTGREFFLDPDIERLSAKGISLPLYYKMVNIASGNEQVALGTIMDGTYQQVKYRSGELPDIDRWMLYNSLLQWEDTRMRLSSVSEMVKEPGQQEVCREDQQYTMVIAYDYIGSVNSGNRLHEQTIKDANEILPLGYKAEALDNWGWWKKEKKHYWILVLILAVMYVLCSILFESLWKPLAVISMVPFAFIGLFLTFYLFRLNFDQGGFAAFVLLCGLTVNAAIYIINDFNNLGRSSPCSSRRIFLQALHGKISPVLLTILSTVLGLIPFVTGEHREPFWFALAAGTMGGLFFSLVGIILYLPLFFFRKDRMK